MKNIVFGLIFIPFCGLAQLPKYEEIATNYFIQHIYLKEYPSITKIAFSNKTEKEMTSFSLTPYCFKDKSLYDKIQFSAEKSIPEIKEIKLQLKEQVRVMDSKNKSKTKLIVFCATKVEHTIFVRVTIHKPYHFSDSYFFLLSEAGEFIKFCKSGQTI
ncbi:hypothetical protein [Emticicia sp. C21]|uniref:hypothetical protein n=1 Tax=Emticicia sp. C21 TaxID=2302915 RepID=UPI000E3521D9|nr:hypothetical protein [Emticicia sp. C21]RFS18540.1 hypothetical protein D0T08_04630 [Emticicia sp. C21]